MTDRLAKGRLNLAAWTGGSAPPVAVYSVYRTRNDTIVRSLLESMPPGSTARLHGLDGESPALRTWTVSSGPGARMPLLDRLIRAAPPRPDQYVLLADDDAVLIGAGLARFAGLAHAAALDLAMPAHAEGSHWTFRVTCQRPFSTVRRTRFVEVGPLLLLSPRMFTRVHPFPETARMGWGLDVHWSSLAREGMRLGVVDAAPMRHLGAVGASYDRAHEEDELARHTKDAGVHSAYDLAWDTGETWRPWARSAPWISTAPDTLREGT